MSNGLSLAVIGGGPAGMAAAVFAARNGADVTLYEKNGKNRLGKKLAITGKGRCNITNDCTRDEFLANVPRNPRFLYSAYYAFPPQDVMTFFEELGVPVKVERGKRVFPESDRAADVVNALSKALNVESVKIRGCSVEGIEPCDGKFLIHSGRDSFSADRVILATGGMSYQSTGSDGSGYGLAEELGHTVTPLRASLVPLVCPGRTCPSLMGLSLKNISFQIRDNKENLNVYDDFGELMFTHFGLSGPVVLSASAYLEDIQPGRYTAVIDLKPALNEEILDARILSDFRKELNRDYSNSLSALLPSKLIPVFVAMSGINPETKVNSITREERRRIVHLMKHFEIPVSGLRPIDEAIITRGGIEVREIDPKTMESKLVPGLYFAGEIIDADAYTGGFNLQIAWSTGRLAGEHASEY